MNISNKLTSMMKSISGKYTAMMNYIQLALKSIISYKRRSLSIVAGLILGAAIFSSIFFYGSIVKTIAVMDVVNNIEAEVVFYPNDLGFNDPTSLSNEIANEQEAKETTIIYTESFGYITGNELFQFDFELTENVSDTKNQPESLNPIVIDEHDVNNDFVHSIDLVNGNLSLNEGECIVPETLSLLYGLEVGDVLSVNISAVTLVYNELTQNFTVTDSIIIVSNLTISGFFNIERIRTGISFFNSDDVIFSSSNLNDKMVETLVKHGYYLIGVKLDYSNLSTDDIKKMSEEIDIFIDRIVRRHPNQVEGLNLVGIVLQSNSILTLIMQVIDFVLYIPALILSIILINFGADLALQERKYEVGVLKAQGASPKQIKRMIFTEIIIIGIIGETIGIGLGTIGASVVVSSYSFMNVNISQFNEAFSFLSIGAGEIISTVIVTLGILLITTNKKTKTFLQQEVAIVKTIDKPKIGFLKRIYADVFAFSAGIIGVFLSFLREINENVKFQGWAIFLQVTSPILLWYASGLVASRIAPKIPQVLDKYIVKVFKKIGLLIKGSLGRRHQYFPRITLLLCLSVSLSVFTAIQGATGNEFIIQQAETNVGGDMRIELVGDINSLSVSNFTGFEDKIESIVPIYYKSTELYWGGKIFIFGVDLELYSDKCFWHKNAIEDYTNPKDGLAVLLADPLTNIAVDKLTANYLEIDTNSTISLTTNNKTINAEAKIVYEHAPALLDVENGWGFHALVDKRFLIAHFPDTTRIVRVIVNFKSGVNVEKEKLAFEFKKNFDWISDIYTYNEVLDDLQKAEGRSFGIPGLLSINYIIAITISIIGVFIFMMLIINKRRKEFAILIAEGASKKQLILLVISEIFSIAIFATLFGSLIGYLFAYQFNIFISFFDSVLGFAQVTFKRTLYIPIVSLTITILVSFASIIIATLIPAISASEVNVVEEMRVV
ncbi:MAG: ABC transporter permease [Candidatus Heimdallarchaeum endolithica]|uniref:ABC transporter permease n=1 Tax=Candidatus Heimdallarchaeum endolithica TaxID=2876572 RepID=A0A9Y1BRL8_9ARCH|nr:MAG: ABC transporter permease [Candidatus Heimdallarchaeum endolithica]